MKRFVLLLFAIGAISLSAEARKVSGSVISGDEKLSGVIVTDGQNFTQTKENGKFKFEIEDDAEFVYIVTPSGYAADWSSGVPAFYQRAEGKNKFVFDLKKIQTSENYSIIAVGDPQSKTEAHFEKFTGKPLEALCKTAESLGGAAVGITLGDICWDKPEFIEGWKREIVKTGIPFYTVAGNHDHGKDVMGDIEGTAEYRSLMGPENYAFCLGDDVVIMLDNIIYEGKRKYKEGYADHVLAWVEGLVKYIPSDSEIYIAQHSPIIGRSTTGRLKSPENDGRWKEGDRIVNHSKLFDILDGYEVTFLSGHNHTSGYYEYTENIKEHNIASICGSWWDIDHCNDGTPRGFKVFTKENGNLSWYYQPVDSDKDHQFDVFMPGQTIRHPNSIVVNIWDWDPQWKVEWYEDGEYKGAMEQVTDYSTTHVKEMMDLYIPQNKRPSNYRFTEVTDHHFAATPSQYAKKVTISIKNRFGKEWIQNVDMSDYVDVQAHRGGAGLMPENTLEAMKYCMDMGVNTLEMDFVMTGDGQIILSHDSFFHHHYSTRPDGTLVQKDDPREYLYKMTYEEIKKYDVGQRYCEVYPEKNCMPAVKPLAADLIAFVENYAKEKGLSPMRYNIEVKSTRRKGEGENWASYDKLAYEIGKLVTSFNLGDRLVIQCFDPETLNYMHEVYPEIEYSYLISAKNKHDFDGYMALLDFKPTWLSPHHSLVDEELIRKCRENGMKMVPWTADKPEDIKRLIDLKVDAVITNYPDRMLKLTRGFVFHNSYPEK